MINAIVRYAPEKEAFIRSAARLLNEGELLNILNQLAAREAAEAAMCRVALGALGAFVTDLLMPNRANNVNDVDLINNYKRR